jgi:ribosome-binding protein aMBF1 (putative translation factor)
MKYPGQGVKVGFTTIDAKRKRLEAKGWKVGTTPAFLKLTDQEYACVELRLKLADALKRQRMRRNLTQADLAKAMKSSQSRVTKMESGDASVSLDLLVRSLLAIGTSNKELATVIAGPQVDKKAA